MRPIQPLPKHTAAPDVRTESHEACRRSLPSHHGRSKAGTILQPPTRASQRAVTPLLMHNARTHVLWLLSRCDPPSSWGVKLSARAAGATRM